MTEEEQQNTCPSFRSFAAAHDTWRLSRLDNGTRIFEEEEARTNNNELWLSPPPGCKGVGLIFSRPKLLFHLVMDLGKARSQWDLTFDRGSVVERIDEHTDVIRLALKKQCFPQEFCLMRRWSCEPDGSYVVVLSSTEHPECQEGARRGVARGKLFGGWIIAPFSSSSTGTPRHESPSACLVSNVLRLQRRGWFEWLQAAGGGASLTQRVVLVQVAGLRELCEHTSDLRQLEEQVVGALVGLYKLNAVDPQLESA